MGFFDNVKKFFGIGDDEDEKKKRQQQQQQQRQQSQQQSRQNQNYQAPQKASGYYVTPNRQSNQPNQNPTSQRPDNGVNLVLPGQTRSTPDGSLALLKKPEPVAAPTVDPNKDRRNILSKAYDTINTNDSGRSWKTAKPAASNKKNNAEQTGDVARYLLNNTAKVVNTGAEAVRTSAELGRALTGRATGNQEAERAATERALSKERSLLEKGRGVLGVGGALTTDEAQKGMSPADLSKRIVGTGLGTAGEIIPGARPLKGATGLKKAARGAKEGAVIGTVGDVGNQMLDDKAGIDIAQTGAAAVFGGTLGGASANFPGSDLRKPEKPGMRSVNPNREIDATAQVEQQLVQEAQAAQAAQPVQPTPDIKTPAFQRRNEADNARLERSRQADIEMTDELDIPAFQRQGRQLDGPPDITTINDNLQTNATTVAANPAFADLVGESFRVTGSSNPLSLVMNTLARNTDKATVRALVQQLIPDADANTLNRAVNNITGADDVADVGQALTEAAARTSGTADAPLGPLSDAPALPPPDVTPEVIPSPSTAIAPVVDEVIPKQAMVPENVNVNENPVPVDMPVANVNETPGIPEVPGIQEIPVIPQFPGTGTDVPAKAVTAPAKAVAKTSPAKALAKTPQSELPPAKVTAPAKAGDVGKSAGKYSKGQEYEKTSIEATRQRGDTLAANDSYDAFVKKVDDADGMTGADRDEAVSLQGRQKIGTPEHRRLGDMINKYNTESAQALGTIERVIRKTADASKITDRFVNRLYASTDDSVNFTDKDFDDIIAKNDAFVKARDDDNAALEAFNGDPSDANTKAVAAARKNMTEADRAARFTEYKTAARLTKKSKNPASKKLVADLEKKAGVYTMDWPDSAFLSPTGVMINNFINTLGVRNEEAIFGKVGAAYARLFTGTDIGGGSRAGSKFGRQAGTASWRSDSKLRQGADENVLTKSIKNFTTTGNTIGDRNTYAAAYSGVFDHYRVKLKKEGYTGDELTRRTTVNSIVDPDDVVPEYMNQALASNAMSSLVNGPNGGKLETFIAEKIAGKAGGIPGAQTGAKLLVRITLGFPTVITRSLLQGSKRATLGFPSLVQAVYNAKVAKGTSADTARHLKNSFKELGSGATMYGVGFGLGTAGVITGSYPQDKDERERWKRERITENAIKIGDDYYSLPAALGVFALPFMMGANVAGNVSEGKKVTDDFVKDTMSTLVDSMPTDSITNVLTILSDMQQGKDVGSKLAQIGSSAVRGLTPLGGLVNQVAKMFDPTANDTTKGDAMAQFLAKVKDGIPVLNSDLPTKQVDGKDIMNPDPVAKFFGARSTEQKAGVETSQKLDDQAVANTKELNDSGLFKDSIRGLLDEDSKKLFDRAKGGESLKDEDMKKILSGVTKGVTEDADTRFLEDGDYDSNLTVLKTKRKMMADDPTTRQASLDKYDAQIKRGEIYKEQKTPYKLVDDYKEISLEEWRDLGDEEKPDYNPERYQQLFDLDRTMTEQGISRKSSDPAKPKYFAKETASGKKRGGSGGSGGRGRDAADLELARIKSNTVSSPDSLSKFNFDLAPQKAGSAQMQKIQQTRSSPLKKRAIKVSKG